MRRLLLMLVAFGALSAVVRAEEPRRDSAWVNGRIDAWQPKPVEKAFDRMGWASDVRQALRLGQEYHRTGLLFTYDGAILPFYRS